MINKRLRKRIRDQFETQTKFAEHMKVGGGYISDVVRGFARTSDQKKREFALELKCNVEDIFEEEE